MIWDGWNSVMGMNARNERIARDNSLAAVRLVDDKYHTKEALIRVGAPVVPTLTVIRNRRQLKRLAWSRLPDAWALKPNSSLGGNGIVIATERTEHGWSRASGQPISEAALSNHVRRILEGEYSPRDSDWALFEPLVRTHPMLSGISHRGLPDVRVICEESRPVLAMVRLPTAASDGRANLHQGAIGAAVDLDTGVITQARWQGSPVDRHPDTNASLIGVTIPQWAAVIDAARRCARATGLRYLGADIVVDRERGPVILEVNARPGLEIQNVNREGLIEALDQRPTLLQSEQGSASSKLTALLASAAILAGGIALASPSVEIPLPDPGVRIVEEDVEVIGELQRMIIQHEPNVEGTDRDDQDERHSDDGAGADHSDDATDSGEDTDDGERRTDEPDSGDDRNDDTGDDAGSTDDTGSGNDTDFGDDTGDDAGSTDDTGSADDTDFGDDSGDDAGSTHDTGSGDDADDDSGDDPRSTEDTEREK